VLAGWRPRAMVESPSHLRDHPDRLALTLLAALLHSRLPEITDTLVELLIFTVHRIGARADRKVNIPIQLPAVWATLRQPAPSRSLRPLHCRPVLAGVCAGRGGPGGRGLMAELVSQSG
jgi:hypothetical protein